jgi:hypothetical protein
MIDFLHRSSKRRIVCAVLATVLVSLAAPAGLRADSVVLTSGARHEGELVSVDAEFVVIRSSGETLKIRRKEVASIHFEPPAPPLKVEIRNVKSDDAIDVYLDGGVVMVDARQKGAWIDLTPKLKDGNNPMRLRIRNSRGIWAYHLNLRVNGVVTNLSCGEPFDLNRPCRCCGKTGEELGTIDDLPLVWIHVDRETGTAEVLP